MSVTQNIVISVNIVIFTNIIMSVEILSKTMIIAGNIGQNIVMIANLKNLFGRCAFAL